MERCDTLCHNSAKKPLSLLALVCQGTGHIGSVYLLGVVISDLDFIWPTGYFEECDERGPILRSRLGQEIATIDRQAGRYLSILRNKRQIGR